MVVILVLIQAHHEEEHSNFRLPMVSEPPYTRPVRTVVREAHSGYF